jgi:SAM-dependent methyltransferase
MSLTMDRAAAPTPVEAPLHELAAYSRDARAYDELTWPWQGVRRFIVDRLPLRPGDVVVDVGCGTGLCFPMLLEKVGDHGRIIGIDAASEMVSLARERVTRHGWRNVTLIEVPAAQAHIPVPADAVLFCAVHDIMQSPRTLRHVLAGVRPGGHVVAGGGKWADPWLVALNCQVWSLHAPYVRSFEGFDRPWRHLERLLSRLEVDTFAYGTGYVAYGRLPAAFGREGNSTRA